MNFASLEPYRPLVLRIALGFTVLFWGYEKLTLDKLAGSYEMDYGPFMILDVTAFLAVAGWLQITMGVLLFLGLLTRLNAAIVAVMGLVTIVVPGLLVIEDVPHFAYAFALTGAGLALLVDGGGRYSLDRRFSARRP